MLHQIGLTRASMLMCVGLGFFELGSGFWFESDFESKNHGSYSTCGLLRVKKYDPCLFVALVKSDQIFWAGWVG